MKNKGIILKILLGGSLIVILLLLVVIFSLLKIVFPSEKRNEKKVITNTYSLENINNISFDFKKSNSIFRIGDNENLVIIQNTKEDRFYLNYKINKNQLYFDEDIYIINPQKKKYTVYIPKKYINKITIVNGFGTVDLEGITNDIDINNNSGSISLKELGNTRIKDVSGDLSIKDVVGDIDIYSSTGDIKIEHATGKLKLETITGDIKVTKFNYTGDSSFENVSGDINVEINDKVNCNIKYENENGKTKIDNTICKNGKIILNVKNVTGLIKIN